MVAKQAEDIKKGISLNKNANQEQIIDQYKILSDSINTSNQQRESANNFWVTVNSLGISSIVYIRDIFNLNNQQKPLIIWVLVLLGFVLCCSWLSYLATIKKTIEQKRALLLVIENYLPLPIFGTLLHKAYLDEIKNSLTLREMFVPISFLAAYILLGLILIMSHN
ncbi:MAG: hypothetical protein J0H12_01800 [Candidatus Paracaedimonas acanthamoebae]|uniref:Uncharacterized protein n=1 Tax=Candidatus Paracaedimonas acanthamoebae TaxID=244581 RepID=A0A8J7PQG4_9PROT|nr:hypothetical protein [Candidatus Paracaedimonas acanthamoebae]